jgi:hypothetical protein
VETGARFNPEILIRRPPWPYIQPVRCIYGDRASLQLENGLENGATGMVTASVRIPFLS